MKKKAFSLLLAVLMIVSLLPCSAPSVFAEEGEEIHQTLYGSTGGQTLGGDKVSYYYVKSDTSCTASTAGVSGLSIADYTEVHIVVAAGATLTCTGGDAAGWVGGGAGIEVPEHATLYLEGEGTVIATGGNAGNGGNADQGESGEFYIDGTWDAIWQIHSYRGGNGGKGGDGGAGAGAGIGTVGGAGGKGGAGGLGDGGRVDQDHLNVTAGEKGADGRMAKPMGTVRTSRTVKLTAVGGAIGWGGIGTIVSGLTFEKYDYYNTAVHGCYGGGGQGGGAGASIGAGGQGGGGGAGGNGSPAIYSHANGYFAAKLYTGYGGGNTDGNYVEGSNMGLGGMEFTHINGKENRGLMENYPYRERNFGGAGGASSVHIHTIEDGWCIVCGKSEWVIEDGVVLAYNGNGGNITVPEGATEIADNVFNGNKAVTGVVFPSTMEQIGSSAFRGTSLTSLDIPVSVKAIGDDAFADCKDLQSVAVHWTDKDAIITPQSSAFSGIASGCALYVPPYTTALYENSAVWCDFLTISDTVPYMAYDPETGTFVPKITEVAPTPLTSSEDSVVLPGGWYTAGNAAIGGSLTFEGDAYVIFENGATLTVGGGVVVGTELTFYAQTTVLDDMGGLYVPAPGADGVPGINCSEKVLNVHGGKIEVCGGRYAAGIGGADRKYGGFVTVYGGYVKAKGAYEGAGIGGGRGATGLAFTIYGGKVDAYGSDSSGIGGGWAGPGGKIVINGGEVSTGGNIGAGSEYGATDPTTTTKITVNGGTVNVSGDNSNIGGTCSSVEINGGEVKVAQGTIGVDYYTGHNAEITIRGGTVDTYCYYYPALGGSAAKVKVNIYGGSIKARSGNMDAVVATEVNAYPDGCEVFTVKDLSGNELPGSPVTEEADITELVSENKQIQIDLDYAHTFTGAYVDNGDGTHSRKCTECGVSGDAQSHTFEGHSCVCGAISAHDFTGAYVDNGDGTHSRRCTVCGESGSAENHTFVDHSCVCGAKNEHDFTGEYVNNGDGTHSRKCTGCDEYGTPEEHTFVDGKCACGRIEITEKYIVRSWDDTEKKVVSSEKDIPSDAIELVSNTTELGGGWYYVAQDTKISDRLVVRGTAENPTNIVLPDGVTLGAAAGIEVAEGNVLNIYGQKNDTGRMIAWSYDYNAGIGGSGDDDLAENGGTVTVFGGTVIAESTYGAGIGGGDSEEIGGNGGTVTVFGGSITALSQNGAGIGGGNGYKTGGDGGTVTVYGGTVMTDSENGAGIGGGFNGNGGTVTVYDGTVAAGSEHGAGIGGGFRKGIGGDGGTLTVNGGTVLAGSEYGAGIGGGDGGDADSSIAGGNGGIVTVNGGTVEAGSMNGAAIGGGSCGITGGDGGTVTVNGGTVTAEAFCGAGIGGGLGYEAGGSGAEVTVNGGSVTAKSTEGAGIGGGTGEGTGGNGGTLTVKGGTVTAASEVGAGIGGGLGFEVGGSGAEVTVNGGTVTAKSTEGAGIGGGAGEETGGNGGTLTVKGGTVTAASEVGAGIGGGAGYDGGDGGIVTVDSGSVKAESAYGAAVGGGAGHFIDCVCGDGGDGGTVIVNDGNVEAISEYGAGIGGGFGDGMGGNGGIVTVNGGTVVAGSEHGAGIGGGHYVDGNGGNGGELTVNGGTVTAMSAEGAGIGGGDGCEDPGKLTVADGLEIRAGDMAADKLVSVEEYKTNRYAYANISAHIHVFVDGKCACGAVCEASMKIRAASLHIAEDISVVYAAEIPKGFTDPYMVFTFNGRTYTVDSYTRNSKGQYCFELAAITPQCMGDNISATLYATMSDGKAAVIKTEYSVRTYCVNQLAKTEDELFVTLLSDLLTYGAAAQTYTNYKTDALVTDGLALSPSTFTELSGLKEEFVGTADPDTFWQAASLTLRNNVGMNLFFHADNIEGLSVVLEINGRTEEITDFTPVDGNLYQITFQGIFATEFDLPVSASFYRNGAQIGNTLNYSVSTYICSKQNDSDEALAAMVQALYNYGATANTYYFERYLKQ